MILKCTCSALTCMSIALDLYFYLPAKYFHMDVPKAVNIAKAEFIKSLLKSSLLASPFSPSAQIPEVKMSLSPSLLFSLPPIYRLNRVGESRKQGI